jgi:rSAM/selenodomain-associated transferase 2
MISVVIPTLNADKDLVRTLSSLLEATMRGMVRECIIADGGSTDLTLDIAEDAGCEIVRASASRGGQLAAGAAAAKGPWLLFLHADTALEPGWDGEAYAFIREGKPGRAATFRFALDSKRWTARRAEWLTGLRNRVLALPYGDQGLLIAKRHYNQLGGFKPLQAMEDVEFVGRLKRAEGRAGLQRLNARAIANTPRYRDRPFKALSMLTLYGLGVSPERLARMYR